MTVLMLRGDNAAGSRIGDDDGGVDDAMNGAA